MALEENLSIKNAFARFACGASCTAIGISKLVRKPDCIRGRAMILFGAMKMAEGVTKYCPTKAMLNSSLSSILSELQTGNSGTSTAGTNSGMASTSKSGSNSGTGSTLGAMASAVMGGTSSSQSNPLSGVTQIVKDITSAAMPNTSTNQQQNQQQANPNTQSNSNQASNSGQQSNLGQQNKPNQMSNSAQSKAKQANSNQQSTSKGSTGQS
ncbi:YgaP-like transmembrane domain [Rummeliibacillus suwonensis]|jgi:hypothetical protein|uniref:YgaP-like transmembrane domain n=1 Tax=Rummeliibacillus suwonensis TaxID=1306154 RepID=UPI0011B520FA|nr:YgaP-like transmembrane domain [Rummeliibacillus suwonensis]